jgi:hypothetical protein
MKKEWDGVWRHFSGSCQRRAADLHLSVSGLHTSGSTTVHLSNTDEHLSQNSFAMLSYTQIPYPLSGTWTSSLNHKRTKLGAEFVSHKVLTDVTITLFRRMASSGMLRRVTLVITDVSEELSASIIRVIRIGELGATLAVTSNRRTLRLAYICT